MLILKEKIKHMHKQDFISRLSELQNISKVTASDITRKFLDTMVTILSEREKIEFRGFGSFYTTEIKERIGIHPKTKQTLKYPAITRVKFKASKNLREAVNA